MSSAESTNHHEEKVKKERELFQLNVISQYPGLVDKSLSISLNPNNSSSKSDKVYVWFSSLYTPSHSKLMLSLLLLLAYNVGSAFLSPMDDCDEVFNYWEPMHFIATGKGFQTWEYAPKFALRSYSYLWLFAMTVIKPLTFLNFSKVVAFYAVRLIHGLMAYLCMEKCLAQIDRFLHPRLAQIAWLICLTNSGLWVCNTALLPSSFSSYMVWLVAGYWLQERYPPLFMAAGMAAFFGWPFVAIALVVPFFSSIKFEANLYRSKKDDDEASTSPDFSFKVIWSLWFGGKLREFMMAGLLLAFYLFAPSLLLDYNFYGHFTIPQLNLILYNVFQLESGISGPDLYGTEPWYFYLLNCLLHFHVWFLAALVSLPLTLVLRKIASSRKKDSSMVGISFLRILSHVSLPFYVGLGIFSWQAHKEERFLYIIYPWIIINASIGCFCLERLLLPIRRLAWVFRNLLVVFVVALTLSRIIAISSHHRIIPVYDAVAANTGALHETTGDRKVICCLGSEWYRFPSHFFLPDYVSIAFLRSPFRGLLPSYYYVDGDQVDVDGLVGSLNYRGRVNPFNKEEIDRYIDDKAKCDYFVGISENLESTRSSSSTEEYYEFTQTELEAQFNPIKCVKFVEQGKSSFPYRSLWFPHNHEMGLHVVDYCLYGRRK